MQTAEPARPTEPPPASDPGPPLVADSPLVADLARLAATAAPAAGPQDAPAGVPAASTGATDAPDRPAVKDAPDAPIAPDSPTAPTACPLPDPAAPPPPAFTVLADRHDATVVRVGAAVAKAHPVSSVPGELAVRLAAAEHPLLRGIVLPPLPVRGTAGGRQASVWPYGRPVDPRQPHTAPWEEAAVLLARLHAVPWEDMPGLPGPLPPMRGPAKAARAMARLGGVPDGEQARTVRRAWRRLPAWARGEEPYRGRGALCHGDWHLGQLVRHPAPDGPWLLIDVDDLGTGDPAWDLARPAMWFAAGLLAPRTWALFLAAYRAAGGTAVPPEGDPWPRLDVPARTLAVQTAAIALAKAARDRRPLDPAESDLLAACERIGQLE